MEIITTKREVISVYKEDFNRLEEIVELIALQRDDLLAENKKLKSMMIPKEIDMEKYNKLDLSDIDLSKQPTKSLAE